MISRNLCLLAVVALPLLSTSASADISDYGVQKTNFYTEGGDNSASYTNSSIYGFVDTTDASDTSWFTLTSTGNFATTYSLLGSAPGRATGGNFFASTADMDAAFPAGSSYEIIANNGSENGMAGILPTNTDAFPDELVLTGTSYSGAQSLNAKSGYDFTFAPMGGGANDGSSVALTITDSMNNVVYYSTTTGGDFFIPGGVFADSMTYSAQLANFNTDSAVDMTNFTNARTTDGFVSSTLFSISTTATPEPGTWMLLGAGVMAVGLFRRFVLARGR